MIKQLEQLELPPAVEYSQPWSRQRTPSLDEATMKPSPGLTSVMSEKA